MKIYKCHVCESNPSPWLYLSDVLPVKLCRATSWGERSWKLTIKQDEKELHRASGRCCGVRGGRDRALRGRGHPGRVKGRERDWGSAWYSKLTHSHGTQAPIRVRATLIKPDLQPLAAGWVNVCGSLDVCVFRIVDVCVCVWMQTHQ